MFGEGIVIEGVIKSDGVYRTNNQKYFNPLKLLVVQD